MRSPIAVPRLGLQDLIVPGVSGPAEGQSFWKSFFILTLRLCMAVHFLFIFSGMGNALYLRKKKVELICLLCSLCLFNNVAAHWEVLVQLTRRWCASGLFFWGDELSLLLKVLWTPQNLWTASEHFWWFYLSIFWKLVDIPTNVNSMELLSFSKIQAWCSGQILLSLLGQYHDVTLRSFCLLFCFLSDICSAKEETTSFSNFCSEVAFLVIAHVKKVRVFHF